jgi:uncharacterized protein (TIRG00374 family)
MNKIAKNLIKLTIGLAILFIVFYRVGFGQIFETLKTINTSYLLLIALCYVLFFIFGTLNLWILYSPLKKLKFSSLLKKYLVSWSLGMLVPGKLGELSIAYFLKDEIPLGKGAAVAVMDKIVTLFTLAVVALIGIVYFFGYWIAAQLGVIVILAGIVGLVLFVSSKVHEFVKKVILRRFAKKLKGFSSTFIEYAKKHKIIILFNSLFSLIKWSILSFVIYFTFASMGMFISPLLIFIITIMTSFISLIPITIEGLGVREGVAVYLYGLISVEPRLVASMSIFTLVVGYGIAGAVLIWGKAK